MSTIPNKMSAVLTTGHGGFEVLEFRNNVKVPQPNSDQVLIKVLGAGINNTDINTRTAWYSKSVKGETNAQDSQGKGDDDGSREDANKGSKDGSSQKSTSTPSKPYKGKARGKGK